MGEAVVVEEMDRIRKEEDDGSGGGGGGGSSTSTEMVRWEKFLPRMVLRVLLVEADDSTRHVISALLRKCSYTVAAVPDGLMAWETLKGRPHNIDLILTEVELPSISGYPLLTLIMEHDICKNIPVIMMSSKDSISMVLKCMLKGAADFLIKPVRKNELKNLWQHVWRRQTHKVEGTSENNAASNHSRSDCATSLQKNQELTEKGSDAQSCCLTPYLEAESFNVQTMQGLPRQKCEGTSNQSDTSKENNEGKLKLGKSGASLCKAGERLNSSAPEGTPCSGAYDSIVLRLGEHHGSGTLTQDENMWPEKYGGIASIGHGLKPSNGAIDLIGTIDGGPKHADDYSSLNDGTRQFEFTPQLELSLRRYPNSLKNHSKASAFSLYNGKPSQPLFPTSNGEIMEDSNKSPELSSNQPSQNTSGVSSRPMNGAEDVMTTLVIGQSEQAEVAYPTPQIGSIPVPGAYGNVIPPTYYAQSGLSQAWNPNLVGKRERSPFPSSASVQSNPEIPDSDQNRKLLEETTNASFEQDMPEHKKAEPLGELRQSSPAAGQSTSSSLCNGTAHHNNNSSTYGSLSSRNDGDANSAVASDMAAAPANVIAGGRRLVQDQYRGMDPHRSSQREAALTKFRLKRKDRCFEKKVRYQSRKRLAEQRPRVKGQFVRQAQNDIPMADANG